MDAAAPAPAPSTGFVLPAGRGEDTLGSVLLWGGLAEEVGSSRPAVVGEAPPGALEPDTFHVFGGEGFYAATPPGTEPTESGLDLRFQARHAFDSSRFCEVVSLGVHVILTDGAGRPAPFLVLPRSSISKTPLMLANSPGLVDATYRGPLRVAVRHLGTSTDEPHAVESGVALFQAVAADLRPRRVAVHPLGELAEAERDGRLPPSARGAGGFGSTGAAGSGAGRPAGE